MELITGATGFIGNSLALRRLEKQRPIRLLCREQSLERLSPRLRENAEIVIGDLRDRESLERAVRDVDLVFHCAGHVSDWGTDAEFEQSNVRGTEWLLESSTREPLKRFVHLSSIAVFGVPSPVAFDDWSPYGTGKDPYSRTKIAGETLALRYHAEAGLPVTVLRPAVVYGPRSTWVEQPLKMIQQRRMFLIGGGRGTCHPCYIENLLDAMELVAVHPAAVGEAFIVADDEPVPFREYFDHLARVGGQGPLNRSLPLFAARAVASGFEAMARLRRRKTRPLLTHTAIDLVCTPSRMSMRKIRDKLGFHPRYGLSEAMTALASFYKTSSDQPPG
jgi:nucleoside-diphosphate-sugar epimerase